MLDRSTSTSCSSETTTQKTLNFEIQPINDPGTTAPVILVTYFVLESGTGMLSKKYQKLETWKSCCTVHFLINNDNKECLLCTTVTEFVCATHLVLIHIAIGIMNPSFTTTILTSVHPSWFAYKVMTLKNCIHHYLHDKKTYNLSACYLMHLTNSYAQYLY